MSNNYNQTMAQLQTLLQRLNAAMLAEEWEQATDIVHSIAALRKTNPDIVGILLQAIGGFLIGLPNPAASLLGGAMLTAAKIRSAVKVATKLKG